MIRFLLKLAPLFLIVFGLSACSGTLQTVKGTFGGAVQNVKGTYAKDNANSAYDRKDYPTALAGYQNAAELGNAEAQYYLSFMYLEGKGIAPDTRKALLWMQKAAGGGFTPAQVQMGLKHLAGSGVSRDPVKAHAFFEKAAQSENPEAQYFLAVMAATGQGTTRNTDQALRWFRMARSNGFPVPQELLTQKGITALGYQMNQATAPANTPTVPSGKELIRQIQSGLTRLGFQPGPVDGVFGGKTASAIKLFQSHAGLAIDGKATRVVLKEINAKN